jgi:hypothetical protein
MVVKLKDVRRRKALKMLDSGQSLETFCSHLELFVFTTTGNLQHVVQ